MAKQRVTLNVYNASSHTVNVIDIFDTYDDARKRLENLDTSESEGASASKRIKTDVCESDEEEKKLTVAKKRRVTKKLSQPPVSSKPLQAPPMQCKLENAIQQIQKDLEEVKSIVKAILVYVGEEKKPLLEKHDQKFPLATLNELQEFEDKLSDPGFESYVGFKFRTLRSQRPTQTCISILKFVLTNDVGNQLSWAGSNDKLALKEFERFCSLLFLSSMHTDDCRREDIVSVVKNWLKNAKRRLESDLSNRSQLDGSSTVD
ncbi:hypothetical protein M8J75_001415 [Diaphorina citri]|nr:hypothetical protein M8J75_001415 [Diaphorina citri]